MSTTGRVVGGAGMFILVAAAVLITVVPLAIIAPPLALVPVSMVILLVQRKRHREQLSRARHAQYAMQHPSDFARLEAAGIIPAHLRRHPR